MQGARCYAANAAINATSALQLTCGGATGSQADRVGGLAINATRWSGNILSHRCRQPRNSYTRIAEGVVRKETATSVPGATPTNDTRRAQRLALYEETMVEHGSADLSVEQKRQQRQRPLDWKAHSLALSEQVRKARKARKARVDTTPESGEQVPPRMSLDYTGLAIEPQTSNTYPPTPMPWAQGYEVRQREIAAAEILDLEIAAFADHMAPTAAERDARLYVRNVMYKIMGTLPDHQPYTFGSFKTGLSMPYSDIDLGFADTRRDQHALEPAMKHLNHILQKGEDYICVVYRPARHSIITAQHKATGLDVQIISRKMGFQDKQVQGYLEKIPHLKQLYSVVRTAFGVRGFVDPFIGGISSYGTFMMLAAALTRRGTPSDVHKSPSSQLLHFLSFWSNFDTTKYGIALSCASSIKTKRSKRSRLVYPRPAKLFRKTAPDDNLSPEENQAQLAALIAAARNRKQSRRAGQYRIGRLQPEQPYLLSMQDPDNAINDLGATCHAIKHILQSIKAMHSDLVHAMNEHDRAPPGDRPKGEMSLLLPLVGRSHELYAERRQRLEDWNREFAADHGRGYRKYALSLLGRKVKPSS